MRRPRIPPILAALAMTLLVVTTSLPRSRALAQDDRADTHDLLETVGMISCERQIDGRTVFGRGTGAVVGSRSTVLTVAHIFVTEPRGGRPRVEFDESDCEFRLFDANGALAFETGFAYAAFGGFLRDAGLPNQDWAVLRLRERVPDAIEPLTFAPAGSDAFREQSALPIEVPAFHADRRAGPRVPQLSLGSLFEVEYAGFRRLAHTAETDRMSSGAPVVHRTANGRRIVLGIHRSQAEYGDFKLTVPLSPELVQALQAYANGDAPSPRQRVAARARSAIGAPAAFANRARDGPEPG